MGIIKLSRTFIDLYYIFQIKKIKKNLDFLKCRNLKLFMKSLQIFKLKHDPRVHVGDDFEIKFKSIVS